MSTIVDRILRPFALVVTDRRWAAPLSAAALGFGLFVGVAIGPNAAGTLAGATQILEVPAPAGDDGRDAEVEAGASGGFGEPLAGGGGSGGGLVEGPLASAPPEPAPLAPAPVEDEPAKAETEPAPAAKEAPAEEDEETELKGVVVQANPAAGSYALAIEGGELVPIHARKLPSPGTKLTVLARRLANGTFTEVEAPMRSGKATQATFRGVVTYADSDPATPAYTVSGRGSSLLVHVEPDPTGAAPQLPAIGARVTVTATIREGLRQHTIEVEAGAPSTYLDLTGIVQAVLLDTAQLLLSADDLDQSEADLTLAVPAAIELAAIEVGDSYLVTATVEADGSLALAGIASDEQVRGADDPKAAQGDLRR